MAWTAHGSKHFRDADSDYCRIVEILLAAGANRADSINQWGVTPEEVGTQRVATLLKSGLSIQ